MTTNEIVRIRNALRMTQAQLALLLGVHAQTVYRWESDRLVPTPFQAALLDVAARAVKRQPDIGAAVAQTLTTSGAVRALFELLCAAFKATR